AADDAPRSAPARAAGGGPDRSATERGQLVMGRELARIGKARALLREGQYAELLDQLSSRLHPAGNPVLYWDRFVVVALAPGQARPPARIDRIPTSASLEDIEALCRARPDRAALFRRRLREGQRCFVIHEDGQ